MIRPTLIIPVGRLAITKFLPNVPLDQLIGRIHDVEHAHGKTLAIPLPHPSGASSWIHEGNHPQLLDAALRLIGDELVRLKVVNGDGPTDAERGVMRGFILLFTLHFHDEHPGGDRWLSSDKAKHFFTAAFVQSVSFSGLRTVRLGRHDALIGATAITSVVSVGKEIYDQHSGRLAEPEGSDVGRRGDAGGDGPSASH